MKKVNKMVIGIEDRLPLSKEIIYGFQHIMAMFGGVVAVPLMVGGAIGLTQLEMTILIEGALIASGIGTVLQTGRNFSIGARLPICMGTAFVFISPMIGIGKTFGMQAIFGALIIGGLVEFLVSKVIWRLKELFPPLVTGVVISLIGLTMIPLGFQWSAGGFGPLFGKPVAFIISGLVLLIMVFFNHFTKGFLQTVCILLAIAFGYVISASFGILDFNIVRTSSWVALPQLFYFGPPQFYLGAILGVLSAQFGSMLETIGDIYATGAVLDKEIDEGNLQGGIAVDGLGSIIATLFNGFSLTTFTQNIGVIGITRVGSRRVVRMGGIIFIILGLFPKFAAIITAMPDPVLGGTAIVMFGSIFVAGIDRLSLVKQNRRNSMIIATAIALGLGFGLSSEQALAVLPTTLQVFLHSGIIVGGVVAILMDQLIPKEKLDLNV